MKLDRDIEQPGIDWAIRQPCLTRCAFCDWLHLGTVAEGQQAHLEHRKTHNVKAKQRARRRHRPYNPDWGLGNLDEHLAAVRAQGGGHGAPREDAT